ncbi:unnamed protein product [Candidula unifasciata]|uniref:DNA-directed RNA polymerase III subunit n=1 Tax=Candidula unifasciata TaxID=100452 RepID=A0A8S3ZZE1_9EUPU|nr:unnamed protein product [Candidula unifasciata]
MAGRGRGRGRGLSINIEALGLGREEILPAVAQPPPLYPPLQFKPVPLPQSSDLDYMLALKQELRESFHKSPFYIKAPKKVKDIERYSDKYQPGLNDSGSAFVPDWTRLPHELREVPRKRVKVNRAAAATTKVARPADNEDVSKLLEKLEQTDTTLENTENAEAKEEGDDEEKKGEDGEGDEEEEYDEEDAEEETDYNQAYFDNGEEYGDDDEDDDEGPTY